MSNLATFEKGLKEFKSDVEDELMEISRIAANTTLLKIIQQSPYPRKSRSEFSKGCYVLSHRVSANIPNSTFTFWGGAGKIGAPSGKKVESADTKARSRAKSWSKKAVKKPYQKTIISNTIPYGYDVEIGAGWGVPGYYPYKLAFQFIKNQIPVIIKSVAAKSR